VDRVNITTKLGALALTFSLATPAKAEMPRAADIYEDLCVGEQYHPGAPTPPRNFESAERIDPSKGMVDVLPSAPFTQKEGWLLNPNDAANAQLVLVGGLMQHPTMGEMGVCIIMAPMLRVSEVRQDLFEMGAEEDGGFLFMAGPRHLWMIQVSGEGNPGPTVIMGTTPNGPLPPAP